MNIHNHIHMPYPFHLPSPRSHLCPLSLNSEAVRHIRKECFGKLKDTSGERDRARLIILELTSTVSLRDEKLHTCLWELVEELMFWMSAISASSRNCPHWSTEDGNLGDLKSQGRFQNFPLETTSAPNKHIRGTQGTFYWFSSSLSLHHHWIMSLIPRYSSWILGGLALPVHSF